VCALCVSIKIPAFCVHCVVSLFVFIVCLNIASVHCVCALCAVSVCIMYVWALCVGIVCVHCVHCG